MNTTFKSQGPDKGGDGNLTGDGRIDDTVGKTADAASDVLEGNGNKKTLSNSRMEDPLSRTLHDLVNDLETQKTPTAMEKVRKIQRVLMFAGRYVDVKTDKILLKKQEGLGVGEAFDDHIEIDPVLFDNKNLTEDNLTVLRHVLLHELLHMEKDIDNEGLVELASSRSSSDKIRDYEHLVQNVSRVTSVLGAYFHNGDKEQGINDAVKLYSEKKYDDLFLKFEEAYKATHQKEVSENPDVAEKVFGLAFPELIFEVDGKFTEDEDAVEEEHSKVHGKSAKEPSKEAPAKAHGESVEDPSKVL